MCIILCFVQGSSRPNPREISLNLRLPAGRHKVRSGRHATDMLTYIGQFFDHDIDLTTGADPAEAADFDVPQGDAAYDPEGISTGANTVKFPFSRSKYVLVDGVRVLSGFSPAVVLV